MIILYDAWNPATDISGEEVQLVTLDIRCATRRISICWGPAGACRDCALRCGAARVFVAGGERRALVAQSQIFVTGARDRSGFTSKVDFVAALHFGYHGTFMTGAVNGDISTYMVRFQKSWPAGALLCGPSRVDFVAGTALCEPQSADLVAGIALCEARSADFVAGSAL